MQRRKRERRSRNTQRENETEQKGVRMGEGREGLQSPGAPVVVMRSHYQDTWPLGDAASGQGEEKKTKTEMREERRGKDERRRKPKVASEREKREQRRGNGTGR